MYIISNYTFNSWEHIHKTGLYFLSLLSWLPSVPPLPLSLSHHHTVISLLLILLINIYSAILSYINKKLSKQKHPIITNYKLISGTIPWNIYFCWGELGSSLSPHVTLTWLVTQTLNLVGFWIDETWKETPWLVEAIVLLKFSPIFNQLWLDVAQHSYILKSSLLMWKMALSRSASRGDCTLWSVTQVEVFTNIRQGLSSKSRPSIISQLDCNGFVIVALYTLKFSYYLRTEHSGNYSVTPNFFRLTLQG